MEKPVLVIMAAGMGSRYGGSKQIDPVDEEGHIIIDFSMYDAKAAGFEKVIFIIKRENEADFRAAVGDRISKYLDVSYAYQDLENIPKGYEIPSGRMKPWGTAHAILSCADQIHGPFAVINADDYYGKEAFRLIYDYLTTHADNDQYRYAMIGYQLANTVTDNGYVSRGVCDIDENGRLQKVQERTHIEKRDDSIEYTEDDGKTWRTLPEDTVVSMNLWGFGESIMREIQAGFGEFLKEGLQTDPLKCEYFLPSVVSRLLDEDKATVDVLTSRDRWYGVTYKEDKPLVEAAIRKMKKEGLYPENLWEGNN